MNCPPAIRPEQALLDALGPAGRIISWSKEDYRERHPDGVPIFNANVVLARGKIWHGTSTWHSTSCD